MTKILLICSAGMSTSMLVKKMSDYAKISKQEVIIEAVAIAEGHQIANEWDVILLGPQVGYDLEGFKKLTTKPVAIIPHQIYALGKGKEALEQAFSLLENK